MLKNPIKNIVLNPLSKLNIENILKYPNGELSIYLHNTTCILLESNYKPEATTENELNRIIFYENQPIENQPLKELLFLRNILNSTLALLLYQKENYHFKFSTYIYKKSEVQTYLYHVESLINLKGGNIPIKNYEVKRRYKPSNVAKQNVQPVKNYEVKQECKPSNVAKQNVQLEKSSNETSIKSVENQAHWTWPYMKYGFIGIIVLSLFTCGSRKRVGAVCKDGWDSYSTNSGTCSHHNGVRRWKYEYWWD